VVIAYGERAFSLGLIAGIAFALGCSVENTGVPAGPLGMGGMGEPTEELPDAAPPAKPTRDASAGAEPDTAPPSDVRAPDAPRVVGADGWVGGPRVVAVGQGGRRVWSPDGLTWTDDRQDARGEADPTKHLLAVAFGGGRVVAVGGGCVVGARCAGRLMIFDGERWTETPLPDGQSWLSSIAYGGGVWVAAGAGGGTVVSPDGGKHWMARNSLPATVRALGYGSVGGTAMFVAVGDNGLRAHSRDGVSWLDVKQGFPGVDDPVSLRALAIGNETIVAAGAAGRRIRSSNGADWTDPAAGGHDLASLVFADRTFLAYTDNGVVFLSTDDGRSWRPQTVIDPPNHSVATGMMSGARLFVAAEDGVIKTSPNGLAWSTRLAADANANALYAFVFAGL
jgi:hypothetical protein